jgi:hypothetical protein
MKRVGYAWSMQESPQEHPNSSPIASESNRPVTADVAHRVISGYVTEDGG